MRRNRVGTTVVVALWLVVQLVVVSGARADTEEVVEQEFLGAIPSACGGKYYISQEEVEQPGGEPIGPR